MLTHIIDIEPLSNYQLSLSFDDGKVGILDMNETISLGGVFSKLADRSFFAQVQISEDKRYIQWGNELDFCADALYEEVTLMNSEPIMV